MTLTPMICSPGLAPRHYFRVSGVGDVTDLLISDFGAGAGGQCPQDCTPRLWWWAFSGTQNGDVSQAITIFYAPHAAAAPQDIIPLWSADPTAPTPLFPVDDGVVNVRQSCCCEFVPREGERCGGDPWTLRLTTSGFAGAWTMRGFWTWEPVDNHSTEILAALRMLERLLCPNG